MPLTPNGKLDRKALPAPEADVYGRRDYREPESEVERTVAAIWAEVLKLDRVSIDDKFFELGGHSLLATRVMMRLREALNVEVPVRTLFEAPTVRELSKMIDTIKLVSYHQPSPAAGDASGQQRETGTI
jgi:acyl carrier protein